MVGSSSSIAATSRLSGQHRSGGCACVPCIRTMTAVAAVCMFHCTRPLHPPREARRVPAAPPEPAPAAPRRKHCRCPPTPRARHGGLPVPRWTGRAASCRRLCRRTAPPAAPRAGRRPAGRRPGRGSRWAAGGCATLGSVAGSGHRRKTARRRTHSGRGPPAPAKREVDGHSLRAQGRAGQAGSPTGCATHLPLLLGFCSSHTHIRRWSGDESSSWEGDENDFAVEGIAIDQSAIPTNQHELDAFHRCD